MERIIAAMDSMVLLLLHVVDVAATVSRAEVAEREAALAGVGRRRRGGSTVNVPYGSFSGGLAKK